MSPTSTTAKDIAEATQTESSAIERIDLATSIRPAAELLHGLRFVVAVGPDKGKAAVCEGSRFGIGTARDNGLVLTDPTVSRRHCELLATSAGLILRDLHSTNGTRLAGCRVESAYIRPGATVRIGSTMVGLESIDVDDASAEPRADRHHARALGKSPAMLRIFSILARVSRYDSTVLLEGETGTGKSLLARTIHDSSARARAPFVVVDCGAIPATLIESELFGHEKGAFTGAQTARMGSFEAARGGTIFLDEIGELPLDMQPKLLRALEDRVVKRIGSTTPLDLDVRVIAATNRNLQDAVARGAFRSDLLYRLNTVSVSIPPLRERAEDIPALAEHFYRECIGDPEATLPPSLQNELLTRSWPGNARELRSALERLVVLGDPWPHTATPPLVETQRLSIAQIDPLPSFREAKETAVALWEQHYVEKLLERTRGNLSQAAREVRMDRNYLREIVRRRGLGGAGSGGGPTGTPRA